MSASTWKEIDFVNLYDAGCSGPWDLGGRPQPCLVEAEAEGLFNGTVLACGCGTGDEATFLSRQGYSCMAFDCSSHAIDIAEQRHKDKLQEEKKENQTSSYAPLHFLTKNALNFSFSSSDWAYIGLSKGPTALTFDSVLDCGLFHHLTDVQMIQYSSQLAKHVKPGGIWVIFARCTHGWSPGQLTEKKDSETAGDQEEVEETEAAAEPSEHDGPRFVCESLIEMVFAERAEWRLER